MVINRHSHQEEDPWAITRRGGIESMDHVRCPLPNSMDERTILKSICLRVDHIIIASSFQRRRNTSLTLINGTCATKKEQWKVASFLSLDCAIMNFKPI